MMLQKCFQQSSLIKDNNIIIYEFLVDPANEIEFKKIWHELTLEIRNNSHGLGINHTSVICFLNNHKYTCLVININLELIKMKKTIILTGAAALLVSSMAM